MARAARRRARSRRPSGPLATRAGKVWTALLAAMTTVGGLLLLIDGKPAPRLDGFSLPPLMAAGVSSSIESVLQTRTPLDTSRWQAIVIHHSGQPVGSPASIEAEHQRLRFRGLGHHFVIGNGSGMEDGQIHVGYRWLDQLPGAHAGGPKGAWYNQHAISICLVGDGDRRNFSKAQMQRLVELVDTLRRELNLPADRVLLHADVAPTTDPGRLFPTAWLRQQLAGGN